MLVASPADPVGDPDVCKELEYPLPAWTEDISDAELERRFQAEQERLRLAEERIWRECERLDREFHRPHGLLGWLGYRTSVPGL